MHRIILISFLVVLVACSQEHSHKDKMVFRYNESAGVSSLDPAYSRNLENIWVCNMLYNGLVTIGDDLNVYPAITKHWTIDSTGTHYTFHLRNDVFFHDNKAFREGKGRRVVAQDFIYSFNRILNPKVSSPGIWVFGNLRSEKPFRAEGDSILHIYLDRPFPPFLGLLGMKYCSVLPKEGIEKYGEEFRSNPVGTGPFKFNFWIENTQISLLKNENYFEKDSAGKSLPYLDAVAVSFIPDMGSAYLDFMKGNFDLMSGLHSSYSDELLTPNGALNDLYKDQIRLEKHPFLKTDYFGFNTETETAWQNPELRKAVNYAIDRESMVRYLRNNVFEPANGGFIPKGMPGHITDAGYTYNPDSVRAILIRQGYSNGEGLPVLTLSTTSDYKDLCEYAQHQLGEFGIEMEVNVLPASSHRELVSQGKLEFFRKSWLADYPDDENFMALFYSENKAPSGPNYTRYDLPQFDSLYNAALSTTDPKVRSALYAEMDSLVMTEAPVVPLYYDMVMRFVQKNVSGLDKNPMNILDLRRVKIE